MAGPGTGQVTGFGTDRPRRTAHQTALGKIALVAAALALLAAGCGGGGDSGAGFDGGGEADQGSGDTSTRLDPSRYSAKIDHPLVPLSTVRHTVFEGKEGKIGARVEQRVLDKTSTVAGVPVAVVAVTEYENGEIIERTQDYYAQRDDGAVMYMGEHVNDFKDGKLVGHGGQWLAGKDGAKPGLFMPADPKVGQDFEQERAPGVAEDRSSVVEVGLDVTVPAGSYSDCIRTKDVAPLDNNTEFKYYCPAVGLVREEAPRTQLDLVRYR